MTSRLPDATDLTTLLRRQVDELRQYGLALAGLVAQEYAPGDPSGRVLTHTGASLDRLADVLGLVARTLCQTCRTREAVESFTLDRATPSKRDRSRR